MRPTNAVAPEDSLIRAGAELRRNGGDVLPVTSDGLLHGVVTEASLARTIADGIDLNESATHAMVPAAKIAPYASGAEALRRLAEEAVSGLVVVDDFDRVVGLVSATDLLPRKRVLPRPSMVGGMATPFGVYLTNGVVSGGAGGFALVCTGMIMFLMLFGATTLVSFALPALLTVGVPPSWGNFLNSALGPALFLLGMRLVPLSGTHAAEHQVVHAIERGEDLVPDVVRRMPRVHPRCGTNLAAAATIFLGIAFTPWIAFEEVRVMVAFLVTMMVWRPLGSWLQAWVTTRPANDRQLASGIRAGRELLEAYARSRVAAPSIPQRLWSSGVLHVMAGSALMMGIVALVAWIFNLPVEL